MTLLGPRLTLPFIAAVILAAYATCYALVLAFFSIGVIQTSSTGFFFVLGLFFLAATPFIALSQIARVRHPDPAAPVRPVLMTFVMLAPAIFWSYIGAGMFGPYGYRNLSDFAAAILTVGGPAVLSFWLAATFALIALRNRR